MKKTILLVDDEIDILDIQNRYLLQAGYDVLVAHDGKEGLELFRKKSIDLIITDIMMPNMNGYDFISEVQYIAPDQPFLFTTAKTSEQDKIYGLSLGADDFIAKPLSDHGALSEAFKIRRVNMPSPAKNSYGMTWLTPAVNGPGKLALSR